MMMMMTVYYITTNEIPGELLCENMISSHMKTRCHRHTSKDHHSLAKKYQSKMVWYFIGVYSINRTLHCCLETKNLILFKCLSYHKENNSLNNEIQ